LPTSDDHPVTQVAFPDAVKFCEWLGQKEGAAYRLPTLREWRWACKAGSDAPYYYGTDPAELPKYAWTRDNAQAGPQPVGRLVPNAWGLHDMLGNVREWSGDQAGPPGRKFRVACGGSHASEPRQHLADA